MRFRSASGWSLVVAVLGLPMNARGDEPLPGAADFLPSPTSPVGFAGRNNNWYPGATPPLEWWEGQPTRIKGKIGGVAHTFEYGKYPRTAELFAYADDRPKNILWKVPVPGWGDSLPVVVGKRVISLASPHYVTCYDADTGKVIWQDELKLMTLPVLGEDRRTVGPAPEPAEAAKRQDLYERTLAWVHVRLGATAGHRDRGKAGPIGLMGREELIRYAISTLQQWKKELKADHPDIGPTLDGEIEALRACLDGKGQKEEFGKKRYRLTPYAGVVPPTYSASPDLEAYAARRLSLKGGHFCNVWQGVLGDTAATPVSDGKVVCVMFGAGQVAAYEVATGKRLWAWRDPRMNFGSASHLPSPLLWKDRMIFSSPASDHVYAGRGRSKGTYATGLMAVDKLTGRVRREVAGGKGGAIWGSSHGDHMSPCLAHVPDGKGGKRTVVINNKGGVVDAETGDFYGQLTNHVDPDDDSPGWGSGFIAWAGGRLYKGYGCDGPAPPVQVWPLRLEGKKLVSEGGFEASLARPAHHPFAVSDSLLVTRTMISDAATGLPLAAIGREDGGTPGVVGKYLIYAEEEFGDNARMREDRLSLATFRVVDVSDPMRPRPVSRHNLLGSGDLPRDVADKYFPRIGKEPDLKIHALGAYRGIAANFGERTSGVTALGDRLFIRSTTHLYCIGPAVRGAPGDDPKVVALIRSAGAASDLATHLASRSAQYRYEAALRLAKIDAGPLVKRLTKLAAEDPYEEVRAAAVLALNAADPSRKPGSRALLAELAAAAGAMADGKTEAAGRQRYEPAARTVQSLGASAGPILGPEFSRAPAPVKACLLGAADFANVRHEAIFEQALAWLGRDARKGLSGALAQRAEEWAVDYVGYRCHADRRALPALTKVWGKQGDSRRLALKALLQHLPEMELEKFLTDHLAGIIAGPDYLWKNNPMIELAGVRAGRRVTPLLEKLLAGQQAAARRDFARVEKLKRLLELSKGGSKHRPPTLAAPGPDRAVAHGPSSIAAWPGFRGARGDGTVARLPKEMPKGPKLVWKVKVAGECHAGVAVADGVVVTPDCDDQNDYYRCVDAASGAERWKRTFKNGRSLQYGPGPRATPLIFKGKVYVLGAFGDLHCLDLKTGKTVWQKDYRKDLGARHFPTWGFCGSPVLAGGRLIIHPDKLVALDPESGKTLWQGEASGTNYATPLVGTFGGVEQVIDYEPAALSGWELKTGKRLWSTAVEPESGREYVVASPVRVGPSVLIMPRRGDVRLLGFRAGGRPERKPAAASKEFTSETVTATVGGGLVLGAGRGLACLDARDKLTLLWREGGPRALRNDPHIVLDGERALTFNKEGLAAVVAVRREGPALRGAARLCRPTLMPPAVVGPRIYVRDDEAFYCYDLSAAE